MKKNRKVLILEIIVIIFALVGITFAIAYFMNSIGIIAGNGDLSITYTGSTTLPSVSLVPISDSSVNSNTDNVMRVNFTVKGTLANPVNKDIIYDVVLTDLNIPCPLKNNYFKWRLIKNGTTLTEGNFSPTFDIMKDNKLYLTTIQQDLSSYTGTADSYQLLVWISESCTDITQCDKSLAQNDMLGLNVSGKVQIQLYTDSKRTLTRTTGNALSCTLADTVIALSKGDIWSSGDSGVYLTNNHEYRYVGTNVDNWVRFNNDDYRIIGVFDDYSHGVTGQLLVKLIMDRSIGEYSWGATNTSPSYTTYSEYNNNWETANANILLNEYFFNRTDTSLTYGQCSDWTYYSSSNDYKTKNCSKIVEYGIQTDKLRNYIQPATWYLKGLTESYYYSLQEFYICERSDTTTITNCTSGNSGSYSTKVVNKSIGLMYMSDYLYASSDSIVNLANPQTGYGKFGYLNWLYSGEEWTITSGSGGSNVFGVSWDSRGITAYSITSRILRPAFYLKSSVKIRSGDGTINNPYIIG